ncbi:hypothetical protein FACS189426_05280 [Bacteroidia bacterium]|nr:hypothetical protein FACS189426_05280 [Bacteroidia bacterium]
MEYVKEKGKITNKEYQEINEISERTASREISELVKASILEQAGSFGAGSFGTLRLHTNCSILPLLEITCLAKQVFHSQTSP